MGLQLWSSRSEINIGWHACSGSHSKLWSLCCDACYCLSQLLHSKQDPFWHFSSICIARFMIVYFMLHVFCLTSMLAFGLLCKHCFAVAYNQLWLCFCAPIWLQSARWLHSCSSFLLICSIIMHLQSQLPQSYLPRDWTLLSLGFDCIFTSSSSQRTKVWTEPKVELSMLG